MSVRTHLLRLEALLEPLTQDCDESADADEPRVHYTDLEWSIVDIDGWLGGNSPLVTKE